MLEAPFPHLNFTEVQTIYAPEGAGVPKLHQRGVGSWDREL